MKETPSDPREMAILKLFQGKADSRLKAGDLKQKLGLGKKKVGLLVQDAGEADGILGRLLQDGLISVVGGSKEGHHPRPNATYRLTTEGTQRLLPPRPDLEDSQLQAQEAFILLQVFRAREQRLTRAELNGKLKSKTAVGQLEFDVKESPGTVDYHLHNLVANGLLEESRKGVSVSFTLDADRGAAGLARMPQHENVTFTMSGATLNALLAASRNSGPEVVKTETPREAPVLSPTPRPSSIGEPEIRALIDQLGGASYAGKDLIPIHEVRRLVANTHGLEAASHAVFDTILKRMRSEGNLDLIAISDGRDATQEQMDASIPGLNETIFYIVVK